MQHGGIRHAAKCRVNEPRGITRYCDCDGYHTWAEMYEHRNRLFIAACYQLKLTLEELRNGDDAVWRSKLHSDGSSYDGWFIMGIYKDKGKQITYHLPMKLWDETEFADTLDRAPAYDGHTNDDVLERLRRL